MKKIVLFRYASDGKLVFPESTLFSSRTYPEGALVAGGPIYTDPDAADLRLEISFGSTPGTDPASEEPDSGDPVLRATLLDFYDGDVASPPGGGSGVWAAAAPSDAPEVAGAPETGEVWKYRRTIHLPLDAEPETDDATAQTSRPVEPDTRKA